jgi:hypothetical protein
MSTTAQFITAMILIAVGVIGGIFAIRRHIRDEWGAIKEDLLDIIFFGPDWLFCLLFLILGTGWLIYLFKTK